MGATKQLKKMCIEQRLKNFKRNAQILTVLKYGKRKKKILGKFHRMQCKLCYFHPPIWGMKVIKTTEDAPESWVNMIRYFEQNTCNPTGYKYREMHIISLAVVDCSVAILVLCIWFFFARRICVSILTRFAFPIQSDAYLWHYNFFFFRPV